MQCTGVFFVAALVITASTAVHVPSILKPVKIDALLGRNKAATCDFQSILPCGLTFFSNFGYDNLPPNPQDFLNKYNAYLDANGINAITDIKGWMDSLLACTGEENFNACVDWHQIMAGTTQSQSDCQLWEVIFRQFKYMFGDGFQAIHDNYYCIVSVEQHNQDILNNCGQTFSTDAGNDPDNLCRYVGNYLDCVRTPFTTGCNMATGQVVCNDTLIAIHVYDPQCPTDGYCN